MRAFAVLSILFLLVFFKTNGQPEWLSGKFISHTATSTNLDEKCLASCIDPTGQFIYLTGYISNTVDEFSTIEANDLYGGKDGFLAKYSVDGEFEWAINFGTVGHDSSNCLTIDADGNLYIAGSFSDVIYLSDINKQSFNLTSQGGNDGFIFKISPAGTRLQAFQLTDPLDISIDAIHVDNASVYFSGQYKSDQLAVTSKRLNAIPGGADMYLYKLDTNLSNRLWIANVASDGENLPHSITCDDKYIYLSGHSNGSILKANHLFDGTTEYSNSEFENINGNKNLFISSFLKENGSLNWLRYEDVEIPNLYSTRSTIKSKSNNLYIAFSAINNLHLFGSDNQQLLAGDISNSIVGTVDKSNGDFINYTTLSSPSSINFTTDLKADSNQDLLLAGIYNQNPAIQNITLGSSQDYLSYYLLKFDSQLEVLWTKSGITPLIDSKNSAKAFQVNLLNPDSLYVVGNTNYNNLQFDNVLLGGAQMNDKNSIFTLGAFLTDSEIFRYKVIDSDGDGVEDPNDIDDDNDGILDAQEGLNYCPVVVEHDIPEFEEDDIIDTSIIYPMSFASVDTETSHMNFNAQFIIDEVVPANAFNLEIAHDGSVSTENENYPSDLSPETVQYTYYFDKKINLKIGWNQGVFYSNEAYTITVNGDASSIKFDRNNSIVTSTQENDSTIRLNVPQLYTQAQEGNAQLFTLSLDGINKLSIKRRDNVINNILNLITPGEGGLKIKAVEFCNKDFDRDGVPNHLDIDSDNDGIPDNIEAQTKSYVAPNLDSQELYIANNGLNSAYIAGLNMTYSDLDAQPDMLDIDSDNDKIPDYHESGLPLVDLDNNGMVDGPYSRNGYTLSVPISNYLLFPYDSILNLLPDLDEDFDLPYGDLDFRDLATPRLTDDIYYSHLNESSIFNPIINDNIPLDSNSRISIAASNNTSKGDILIHSDNWFSYTPKRDFSGYDSITYSVCLDYDEGTECDTSMIFLSIQNLQHYHKFQTCLTSGSLNYKAYQSVNGNIDEIVIINQPNYGIVDTRNKRILYQPLSNSFEQDSLSYYIIQNGIRRDTATLIINSSSTLSSSTDTIVCGNGVELFVENQSDAAGSWSSIFGNVSFSNAQSPNPLLRLFDTTSSVVWNADNGNGCQITDTFNIEKEAVTVICENETLYLTEDICDYYFNDVKDNVKIQGNCSIDNFYIDQPTDDYLFNYGFNSLTVNVHDKYDNFVGQCNNFQITIIDTISPTVICPKDSTLYVELADCEKTAPNFQPVKIDDNCTPISSFSSSQYPIVDSLIPLGTHTVEIMVTDEHNNTGSCSFNLLIEDTSSAIIICPNDTTICEKEFTMMPAESITVPCDESDDYDVLVNGIVNGELKYDNNLLTYVLKSDENVSCDFTITIDSLITSKWQSLPHSICSYSQPLSLSDYVDDTLSSIWDGTAINGNLFSPSTASIGDQQITRSIQNGTCQSDSTQTIEVLQSGKFDIQTDTISSCGIVIEQLDLSSSSANDGHWLRVSNMISFADSSNYTTSVASTDIGIHPIIWKPFNECIKEDTLWLNFVENPEALLTMTDFSTYDKNDVIISAEDTDNYETYWSSTDNVTIDNPKISTTSVSNLQIGDNYIYWNVNNDVCPVTSNELVITVLGKSIPDIITPNGDGYNDEFIIQSETGMITLIIYDRWGKELYRSDNYMNDWNGTYNGQDLPSDTYYYLIEQNGQSQEGALIIKR